MASSTQPQHRTKPDARPGPGSTIPVDDGIPVGSPVVGGGQSPDARIESHDRLPLPPAESRPTPRRGAADAGPRLRRRAEILAPAATIAAGLAGVGFAATGVFPVAVAMAAVFALTALLGSAALARVGL